MCDDDRILGNLVNGSVVLDEAPKREKPCPAIVPQYI